MQVLVPIKETYTETDINKEYSFTRTLFKLPDSYSLLNTSFDPRPAVSAWDKDTNYAKGNKAYTVIEHGGKEYKLVYTAISGGDGVDNIENFPPDSVTFWELDGSFDELSVFDNYLNTQGCIDYRGVLMIYNDSANIAVLNVENTESFIAGFTNSVLTQTFSLQTKLRTVRNFYEYFYKKFSRKKDFLIEKPFINADQMALQFGGNTLVGGIVVGDIMYIGDETFGYNKGNRDFSTKETNKNGNDYIKEGNVAKKYTVDLWIENDLADEVYDFLEGLRAKRCLYSIRDGQSVFGWYKELYMIKENAQKSEYTLEINGVI